jgi:uncharacterized protein (TIGR02996 family)
MLKEYNGRRRGSASEKSPSEDRMAETIEQAFLDAIIENHDDDTPRLVFADWLDDHGRPERAELIRLQCRLARMPEADPERWRLLAREAELLREHKKTWMNELRRATGISYGPFVRGFVEEVRVRDVGVFRNRAEEILARAPLRRMKLLSEARRGMVGCLGACPHLGLFTELDLSTLWLEDEPMEAILRSPYLQNLRVLDLTNTRSHRGTVTTLVRESFCRRLEHLSLGYNDVGLRGAVLLSDWPGAAGLKHLTLEFGNLGTAGARALIDSRHLGALICLELHGNRIGSEFVRSLRDGPNRPLLTHLGLGSNSLGSRGASLISDWPGLARFAYLDLANNSFDDSTSRLLLASPRLSGLKELHLRWHKELGREGAKLTRPGFLSLYNNGITRTGVRALAATPYLAPEALEIWNHRLTSKGIAAWAERFPDAVCPKCRP